uniref:Uncharacterized protein n=1 Tax=Oryza brachyantha TaxID=4533 RepID=J3N1E9_ORYBR
MLISSAFAKPYTKGGSHKASFMLSCGIASSSWVTVYHKMVDSKILLVNWKINATSN